MDQQQPGGLEYQSFLLRMWYASGSWHASLQSTRTEQTYHFADIGALMAFLAAQTGEAPTILYEPPDSQE